MEQISTNTSYAMQTNGRNTVYTRVHNERMGGTVPAYFKAENVQDSMTNMALGFTGSGSQVVESHEDFGFADLIDMVNPLQHIPLVSHAYRKITGDDIKPIGSIVGGALFGGGIGAASGLIDVVVTQETGKDMLGNALSMAKITESEPQSAERSFAENDETTTEALLSFAPTPMEASFEYDMKYEVASNAYNRVPAASGRTAGSIAVYG